MNRRRFLSSSVALIAAGVVDPERLLWVPGQRTIFIPPAVTISPWDELIRSMTRTQIKLIAMQLHRFGRIDTATLLKTFDIPNTIKIEREAWQIGFNASGSS